MSSPDEYTGCLLWEGHHRIGEILQRLLRPLRFRFRLQQGLLQTAILRSAQKGICRLLVGWEIKTWGAALVFGINPHPQPN